jgi:hypothetical protein
MAQFEQYPRRARRDRYADHAHRDQSRSPPNFDDRHTADQFREPLLQLLAVVIGRRVFHLRPELLEATGNCRRLRPVNTHARGDIYDRSADLRRDWRFSWFGFSAESIRQQPNSV